MSNEARPLRAKDESGKIVTVMAERKIMDTAAGACHWPWVYWVTTAQGRKWATLGSDGTLVIVTRDEVYHLTLEEEPGFEEEDLVIDPRARDDESSDLR